MKEKYILSNSDIKLINDIKKFEDFKYDIKISCLSKLKKLKKNIIQKGGMYEIVGKRQKKKKSKNSKNSKASELSKNKMAREIDENKDKNVMGSVNAFDSDIGKTRRASARINRIKQIKQNSLTNDLESYTDEQKENFKKNLMEKRKFKKEKRKLEKEKKKLQEKLNDDPTKIEYKKQIGELTKQIEANGNNITKTKNGMISSLSKKKERKQGEEQDEEQDEEEDEEDKTGVNKLKEIENKRKQLANKHLIKGLKEGMGIMSNTTSRINKITHQYSQLESDKFDTIAKIWMGDLLEGKDLKSMENEEKMRTMKENIKKLMNQEKEKLNQKNQMIQSQMNQIQNDIEKLSKKAELDIDDIEDIIQDSNEILDDLINEIEKDIVEQNTSYADKMRKLLANTSISTTEVFNNDIFRTTEKKDKFNYKEGLNKFMSNYSNYLNSGHSLKSSTKLKENTQKTKHKTIEDEDDMNMRMGFIKNHELTEIENRRNQKISNVLMGDQKFILAAGARNKKINKTKINKTRRKKNKKEQKRTKMTKRKKR